MKFKKNIYSFIEKISKLNVLDFELIYQTSLHYNKR